MNKRIKLTISCVLLFLAGNMSAITVDAKDLNPIQEINVDYLEHIDIEESLVQEENEYYLYFYKTTCPYCLEVSDIISNLSKQHKIYVLSCDIEKNRGQRYDWDNPIHNDIEIGYIDENGNEIYYPGESAEKYLNSDVYNQYGNKLYYKVYTNIPVGQDLEMIYVRMITPEIDYTEVDDWNDIIIAGVPTLLHVTGGHIDEFYFDSVEIKDVFEKGK